MNTLLLIDPPYYRLYDPDSGLARYPLSLGYLANAVRHQTDWEVKVYNADFNPRPKPLRIRYLSGKGFEKYLHTLEDTSVAIWSEVAAVIKQYRPRVLGISCKSQTVGSAAIIARLAKTIDPGLFILAGGPHPSLVGAEFLQHFPAFDAAVRQEGEMVLVQVLEAIAKGKPFNTIGGLIHRKNGEITDNGPGGYVHNLDVLPFPHEAANQVLHEYDRYPKESFSHIFATRGCPFDCFFCGSRHIWGRKVRFRGPANVAREILGLMDRGITTVHFDDDTFGVHTRYLQDLCRELAAVCPGLKWSCELHVKLVTPEHIALMKQAGCFSIQLGIESGNDEILRFIRKGFTAAQALEAAETIHRAGVGVQAFFMVGFPQETEKTLNDTVTLMKRISGWLSYSIFTPYPGTEAFEFCRRHGLVDDRFNTARHNHQSPENCFCLRIPPYRFRTLVARIERLVDQNNYPGLLTRLKQKFLG